jgi:hypothetical protein
MKIRLNFWIIEKNTYRFEMSRKKIAHLCNNLDEFFFVINIEERYILTS